MEVEEIRMFEAVLVREAGKVWDRFRSQGGPQPHLDWLWDLVRLAKHARTRGVKTLSPRDLWWLQEAMDLYRQGGFEKLSRSVLRPKS